MAKKKQQRDAAEGTEAEKSDVARREEDILAYWREHEIFEKTQERAAPKGEYIFYDGPPFATGLPHYGHILAGTIKDVIPRYRTMQGYRVRRQWGWDCHGLPLENEIEKELSLSTKRDIEKYGIKEFNEAARTAVLRYADDWRRIVPRLGRWVDMDRDYRTMDTNYTESVWWSFKKLHEKQLIYEGFKSMHLCPRCETTLSNFEVSQGYADIQDFAVTVKLELVDEPGTYLLVWTTTPWTVPGNMAAAVRQDAVYGTFRVRNPHTKKDEQVIVAKDLAEQVLADVEHELVEEFPGAELVGKSYVPPFSYFADADLDGKEHAWKIYHAPYVSLEEGTGAVHLAPAFGEEDMELAQEQGIPLVHHVERDGTFVDAVRDFAGMPVKPKSTKDESTKHQATDIEIIKKLAHDGKLFAKEKITHAYPHCWRCDTPLLNYATSSWFVRVTDIKDKLVAENEKIRWVPPEIGQNRFGDWLKNARDWAVSRARYWGAPLPVWKGANGEVVVIGSVAELKRYSKQRGNTYYVMRHGQARSNVESTIHSSDARGENKLTETGEEEARRAARELAKAGITKIVTSPLERTQQTAQIIAAELGLPRGSIVTEERMREIALGTLDGRPVSAYRDFADTYEKRYETAPSGGESLRDVKRRVGAALYEIDACYENETVLLVTHEYPAWMATSIAECLSKERTLSLNDYGRDFIETGEVRPLPFAALPHNDEFELDLHRPYIDSIVLEKDGNELTRVADVFDCWYESGSMPYAQYHYPFENRDVFEPAPGIFRTRRGYPADFIAEGLDQTRGWFYSLIVLGTALFGRAPYKNVIVNGTVLAENGQKMSKRLKNYPDPMDMVQRYGADAVRYYLISSPVVKAEDFNFAEDGVAEVMRKLITRTENVRAFYDLYRTAEHAEKASEHILDRWIRARLAETEEVVTRGMEAYELDRAARPLMGFADDLSTWYLRRSRDRLRMPGEDQAAALATLRTILAEYAKLLAPFTPFFAEHLYRSVIDAADGESVHLQSWPALPPADADVLADMREVRRIVSDALEARAQAGIKVRQPLAQLSVRAAALAGKPEAHALIRDEVNVKEIVFDSRQDESVILDTELTDDLQKEGAIRELQRAIQDLRKRGGLTPGEAAEVIIDTDAVGQALVREYASDLMEATALSEFHFAGVENGESIDVNGYRFAVVLSR